MTTAEAWAFNSLNAAIKKFELGCRLYSPQDEVVRLCDARQFYFNVKEFNLVRLQAQYDKELENVRHSPTLTAVITALKKQVDMDIQVSFFVFSTFVMYYRLVKFYIKRYIFFNFQPLL